MMTTEEWRPVVGWEGLYEVSSLGRVRSLARLVNSPAAGGQRLLRERILRASSAAKGYRVVNLSRESNYKTHLVHALVLSAFVGPPPFPRAHGRHLNDTPGDDRLENLAWGTALQNKADERLNGIEQGHVLNEQAARVIKFMLAKGRKGSVLAGLYGVSQATVSAIKKGRLWRYA